MTYLRAGTSAPQNLQRTLSRFLLAGTAWPFPHLGHVRLRERRAPMTADMRWGLMTFHELVFRLDEGANMRMTFDLSSEDPRTKITSLRSRRVSR